MENIREAAALLTGFKRVNKLAPNQTEVIFDNGFLLQSYESLVIVGLFGNEGLKIYLGEHYNYSNTTSKYIYITLHTDRNGFLGNLSKGIYTLLKGK